MTLGTAIFERFDPTRRRGIAPVVVMGLALLAAGCGGGSSTEAQGPAPGPGPSPGPGADTTAPTISINAPTNGSPYTTIGNTVNIGGSASDDTGVTRVTWSSDRGGSGPASGTTSWSVTGIGLEQGANVITVTAEDAAGNTSSAGIAVTRNAGSSDVLRGVAVMGDSNSDEYRADDNRGRAFSSVTFNWVEQLARERGINFGAWGSRPNPRRDGYEYNWARTSATANSLLTDYAEGQHEGVAAQVAAGEVTLVFIHIGQNDFARDKYAEIYFGALSGAALDNKINQVVADITTAVDEVLAAGSVEIILTDLFDYSVAMPTLIAAFPNATRRQAVTDAIRSANAQLATMAQDRGIILAELAPNTADLFDGIDANGFINVGGELIDAINQGDNPRFLVLDDASGHGGTIANSFFANNLFIQYVNDNFGQLITPFTEQEMLEIAGIAP